MPARILIFQGNNCSNKYFWFGVKKSCLIISAVSLTSSVMERWLYILHLVYSVIKKKKTFAADLRIWDIRRVLHGANTAQALHEKDDAILPDSEVHVSLTKQWLYFVNGSSEQSPPAYPGHWGSSIDFSHWVLWLFQIFICPLLLDSSTSLGLPVTNILDHRS